MVGNQEDTGVTADAAALAPFGLSPSGSSVKLPVANAGCTLFRCKVCDQLWRDNETLGQWRYCGHSPAWSCPHCDGLCHLEWHPNDAAADQFKPAPFCGGPF